MGANCCIAIRNDKSLPTRHGVEVPTHRTIRYSPSWSFRCDNRTHIEDIVENRSQFSHGNSGPTGSEVKSRLDSETDGISDGENPFGSIQTPKWQKSPSLGGSFSNNKGGETDTCIGSNSITEENDSMKSPNKSNLSNSKPLAILAPTLSSTEVKVDPSSSSSHSLPSDLTSSRKARHLPGYSLSRQISDNHIPILKSLNENNSTEASQSFVPPTCSSDLSTVGSHSHGGSSDGWSMRMFSELVASSQRDRLSFDSEHTPFGHNKITRTSSHAFSPPPSDVSTCGVCSRLLKERSSWKSLELSVVAVLACGHVYHAECLENVSSEVDKFDPSCPICTNEGKEFFKLLLKKVEMKTRSIADIDFNTGSQREHQQKDYVHSGKGQKMGMTSSLKKSLSKPFLRRHFSIGSGSPSHSLSESGEGLRKKGFWARYRQE